jgi:hypothetical protein
LKAGVLLRAQKLIEKRRQVIMEKRFVPGSVIKSIDERIGQLLNLAEQGKLSALRPADIFFEVIPQNEQLAPMQEILLRSPTTGTGYASSEMPVVDRQLRERCLSILRSVSDIANNGQRLDSVVREMSAVLESRIRDVAGYSGTASGATLLGELMGGENPKIRFSMQKNFQDGAHALFRGYFGFIRNGVMHNIVESYTHERVMQLLGTVDYLLFLLARATIRS